VALDLKTLAGCFRDGPGLREDVSSLGEERRSLLFRLPPVGTIGEDISSSGEERRSFLFRLPLAGTTGDELAPSKVSGEVWEVGTGEAGGRPARSLNLSASTTRPFSKSSLNFALYAFVA
jgi:hypothetical protein